MTVTDQQRAEMRERAEFWTTRDPSMIGHLYDKSAVAFAGEVLALLDALADAWQEGYEEGSASNPYAGDDEPSPNPYLAGPSPTDEGGEL